MARADELQRLDEFTALLDDVQETLPKWTDMPYALFAASAKVCEGLHEWAVKKRAEGTHTCGPEPTPPPEPRNAPERKPDKEWEWPGLERPTEREGRIVSDTDQNATEPLVPALETWHDPKPRTIANPDF